MSVDGGNKSDMARRLYDVLLNWVAPSLGYKLVENRLVTSDVTTSERDRVTV